MQRSILRYLQRFCHVGGVDFLRGRLFRPYIESQKLSPFTVKINASAATGCALALHEMELFELKSNLYCSYLLRVWRNKSGAVLRATLQSTATERVFHFSSIQSLLDFLATTDVSAEESENPLANPPAT